MQWIRSTPWLLASLLACTRGNPAFDEETGGSETSTASETTTEPSDEETGSVAECEYGEGQGLTIELPYPCLPNNEQTQRYEWFFKVSEQTPTGWTGGLCQDPDDSTCAGECPAAVPQAIELGPFDLSSLAGVAGAGACLHIKAAQHDPGVESCKFDAVGIWHEGGPIVMASNGTVAIEEALADASITVSPKPAENPACECVEDCCEVSPGDFAFEVGGQIVPVGAAVDLADYFYVFHPLGAYNPTGCLADMHQVWAMTYAP
ncbi:hypothetical protein ACNOYE_02830 [Nannocystaceae bacterium ST9]